MTARIAVLLPALAGSIFAASPLLAQEAATLEADIRARAAGAPGEVAVALIDLESGLRIGVDDDVSMHAASTMKVPVLVELFRQAAEGRYALTDSITVRNEFTSIADGSTYSLTAGDDSENALYRIVGRELSRLDLATRMITRSSNLATNILIEEVGAENVRAMMAALGAEDMVVLRGVEDIPAYERGMNNVTTAAAFARVLAAIARCERGDVADALRPLTPQDCRRITGILARQQFDERIPAGLPAGIRVANKTGSITEIAHDGAIVYPPGRAPYVLVVLTRGITDRAAAEAAARDISRITWDALVQPMTVSTLPTPALVALHERHRVTAIDHRDFTHAELWSAIGPIIDGATSLTREQIGTSVEGREIYRVDYGSGPTTVLLWSQMHGDESTATMALADIFHFLATTPEHPLAQRLADRLTIAFIPLLNPDGAEDFRRRNAMGIDVNRDARELVTPEARALKSVHDAMQPDFGFNLHDQNPRTQVGEEPATAAIALLAPAWGASGDVDDLRERAIRLSGAIRLAIEPLVGGNITKYDDTFNARAFGDLVTQWGTSTVLIESGGWRDDPEKQYLRRVNFVAILAALDAIATGAYADVDPEWYHSLPYNGSSVSDLVLSGGRVVLPGVEPYIADVAIQYGEPLAWTGGRIDDVGDLRAYEARDTLDVEGLYIHFASEEAGLEALAEGVTGEPANLVIRRGPEASSEAVWVIACGAPVRVEEAAGLSCVAREVGR